MSGLPPQADLSASSRHVAFVPKPAVSSCSTCPVRKVLFDHLVGDGEQRRRNGEVERFRSSHVDARDELRRKLNRQVGGLAAFENSVDEIGGSAMILGIVHAITHESAGLNICVLTGDGREFQGLCQFRYAAKFVDEQEIPQDDPQLGPRRHGEP